MSWLLPELPKEKRAEIYRATRTLYHRQWRDDNLEHVRHYARRYYAKTPARRKYLRNRGYQPAKNARLTHRAYWAKNKDRLNKIRRENYARKKSAA